MNEIVNEMERNPNIEFLRLIAMFMVLMLHALGHGGVLKHYDSESFGYLFFWFIESMCMVSVNSFVLITGYFGTHCKFKLTKILRFYIKVLLFSLICTFITTVLFNTKLDFTDWLYGMFPLTSKRYWFATIYVMLMFIQPALNIFLARSKKTEIKHLIIVLLILFSVLPTILIWYRKVSGIGMDLTWFVVLYFIGAYIHKYGIGVNKKHWLLYYILITFSLCIANAIIPVTLKVLLGVEKGVGLFNYYNTIFVLSSSVCFFMYFVERSPKNTFFVKKFARLGMYSFGAYLISDHTVIRKSLWKAVDIKGVGGGNEAITLCYVLLINLLILFVGIMLDWLITKLMKTKLFMNICKMKYYH